MDLRDLMLNAKSWSQKVMDSMTSFRQHSQIAKQNKTKQKKSMIRIYFTVRFLESETLALIPG